MKMLRRILLFVLVTITLLLLIGFILPRQVHIERSIDIPAKIQIVYDQVNKLKSWEKWSVWIQSDTNMIIEYSGPEAGPGATYSYISENPDIGTGKITIISSAHNDSILLEMDFMESGKTSSIFRFTNENDTLTTLTNIVECDLGKNPVSRWYGLMMDKMIGRDLEANLLNIREISLSEVQKARYQVIEKDMPVRIEISIRDTASPSTIRTKMDKYFKNLSSILTRNHLNMTGSPFAIFHKYSQGNFDIEVGIPVNKIITVSNGVICEEKSAHRVMMISSYGPYIEVPKVYDALEQYAAGRKFRISGPPREEYVTDPLTESDSARWQTNVYIPIY